MYSLNGSHSHDIADNHLVSTASTSVESPFIQNLRRLFSYLSSDEACFDEPSKQDYSSGSSSDDDELCYNQYSSGIFVNAPKTTGDELDQEEERQQFDRT